MDEPSIGHPENLNSANRDIPISQEALTLRFWLDVASTKTRPTANSTRLAHDVVST